MHPSPGCNAPISLNKIASGLSVPLAIVPSSSSSSPSAAISQRYHPFARDTSTSPDHHRITSASSQLDYIGSAMTAPRRRGKLPKDVTELLKSWLMEHSSHPYPNEDEKRRLCLTTGLSISQVSNWFINARRRILAPQQTAAAAAASAASSPRHGLMTTTPAFDLTGSHSAGSSLGQPSPLSAAAEDDYFHSHYQHSVSRSAHHQQAHHGHSQTHQHRHQSYLYQQQQHQLPAPPAPAAKQTYSQQYFAPTEYPRPHCNSSHQSLPHYQYRH